MAADHDRQLDARHPRHLGRPQAGAVDDDRRVDALAARGLHAARARGAGVDRRHADALLDRHAPPPRGLGEAQRDRCRIAVAGVRLPEYGAEPRRIDARLDPRDVGRAQHLGPHAERALAGHRGFERGAHGGRDSDEAAARHVAGVAADGVLERAKDRQRADHHLRGLGRGIELAHDADREAGAAGGERVSLEQQHVARAAAGQVEGDRGPGDAASDDDDVGRAAHGTAARIPAASSSVTMRTCSPGRTDPSTTTRAQTRLQPGWSFCETRL